MSILLRNLLKRYHAPRGGEGEDLPGADYGDDFTPTGDDAPAAKASADADADADAPAGAADEGEGGEGGVKTKVFAAPSRRPPTTRKMTRRARARRRQARASSSPWTATKSC